MIDRQRTAPRRAEGTNGIDRLPLHPRVGFVLSRASEIADQAVIAWR